MYIQDFLLRILRSTMEDMYLERMYKDKNGSLEFGLVPYTIMLTIELSFELIKYKLYDPYVYKSMCQHT